MSTIPHPLALVCELTHRCPLHCVYCSNPRELAARNSELDTETWTSVFHQAAALGVLQADFTAANHSRERTLSNSFGRRVQQDST